MAFDIDDAETEMLIHRLAEKLNVSVEEASCIAARNELARMDSERVASATSKPDDTEPSSVP